MDTELKQETPRRILTDEVVDAFLEQHKNDAIDEAQLQRVRTRFNQKLAEADSLRLFDRADGVRGHFCIGRRRSDGCCEYWNRDGFYSAGEVFTGEKSAKAKLRRLKSAITKATERG